MRDGDRPADPRGAQGARPEARAEGQPEGLSDAELMSMLQAMVEQRCDSSRRYEESGQLELAQREAEEIEVIKRFLPPKLDEQACAEAVRRGDRRARRAELKDAGRVMTELKSRYPGPDGLRQGPPDDLSAIEVDCVARRGLSGHSVTAAREDRRPTASEDS